jgi:hypothetical protein
MLSLGLCVLPAALSDPPLLSLSFSIYISSLPLSHTHITRTNKQKISACEPRFALGALSLKGTYAAVLHHSQRAIIDRKTERDWRREGTLEKEEEVKKEGALWVGTLGEVFLLFLKQKNTHNRIKKKKTKE